MANIFIVGKKGSKSKLAISRETRIRLYKGSKADAIINYGLAGEKLRRFLARHSKAKGVHIINKYIGISKYQAVLEAEKDGILVPESRRSLPKRAQLSKWIEKKVHSSQGKGICEARGHGRISGKYYQQMINNRRFELRVHAFLWVPQDEWRLHKRLGPADQIAWNFHQGGRFQTVKQPNKYKVFIEAKEIAQKILEMRKMSFGAVDLIVDNDSKIYFIEVNASPGFTELSQGIYVDAMGRLSDMTAREVKKYGRV